MWPERGGGERETGWFQIAAKCGQVGGRGARQRNGLGKKSHAGSPGGTTAAAQLPRPLLTAQPARASSCCATLAPPHSMSCSAEQPRSGSHTHSRAVHPRALPEHISPKHIPPARHTHFQTAPPSLNFRSHPHTDPPTSVTSSALSLIMHSSLPSNEGTKARAPVATRMLRAVTVRSPTFTVCASTSWPRPSTYCRQDIRQAVHGTWHLRSPQLCFLREFGPGRAADGHCHSNHTALNTTAATCPWA